MPTLKMYVLCRRDLNPVYAVVQGSHALAQYSLEHPDEFKAWNNTTIAVLGVRNLIEIREWSSKLVKKERIFSTFCEPDLDCQMTAIACYDDGGVFKDLKLL